MHSRRHRRLRSYKLRATLILAIVVFGLGGTADLGYKSLKGRADTLQASLTAALQAGQRELEAGKATLEQANKDHNVELVALASDHFVAARAQFLAAGQLADSSRLLRYMELVPAIAEIAHSRHVAVDGIAKMGVAISDAGQDLSDFDRQLIKPLGSDPPGRTLLNVLDQTPTFLIKVRGDLSRAKQAAVQVDVRVVPTGQQATFVKARDTVGAALAGLDEFERLVPILKEILGGNGARTFLVEQVNPAELRPGGGFIGTYSVVRADHGTLTVIRSGDSYELADPRPLPGQHGFIPQPDPLRDVIPDISWSFVDTNIFPDFPSNARAAEQFAQPRLGMNIDAVISIDYYSVAKMLELTGPLTVPGYGRTVDAGSFIPLVMELELTGSPAHKTILSAIAGPLMARVSALPANQWPALIGDLNTLAAERHIQAYFNDEAIEHEMDRVGWSGSVNPIGVQEFMMEVESNIAGGKSNYFLDRRYSVTLEHDGSVLHHTIKVSLVNHQPNPNVVWPDYRAYAGLYASGNVSAATTDNLTRARYPKPAPPVGMTLLEGWLPIVPCCGGHGSAVFRYDTPWPVHDRGTAQIYWQKQPGTVNDKVEVIWYDGHGNKRTVYGDLSQDRLITLSLTGVTLTAGHPAQATLPSLALG